MSALMPTENFSDYIVYVDESGHASPDPDPAFPCFVLAFCLFEKRAYRTRLAPTLQQFKFQFFGHDMVIMHEREIRKSLGPFSILRNPKVRPIFFEALNQLMEDAELAIIHRAIMKDGRHQSDDNLYHIAAQYCLETLYDKLGKLRQAEKIVHVVFEERGKSEDKALELEFRRICDGENRHGKPYPFIPIFASKKANSSGLQFADLVARPLGLARLRPHQKNRTHDILNTKNLDLPLTQGELGIP